MDGWMDGLGSSVLPILGVFPMLNLVDQGVHLPIHICVVTLTYKEMVILKNFPKP